MPHVEGLLHPEPQCGSVARPLPESNGHLRVTGALPARMRCRSCRDTPSSRAACETFIRNAGSTSSRRISPGCVGSRFNGCRTGSAFAFFVVAFVSVILLEVQVESVLTVPTEHDAPRATDGNRAAALSIAFRWMHTPARQVQF